MNGGTQGQGRAGEPTLLGGCGEEHRQRFVVQSPRTDRELGDGAIQAAGSQNDSRVSGPRGQSIEHAGVQPQVQALFPGNLGQPCLDRPGLCFQV